eukprot:CAMPEP_0183362360 /NCGR_PEP_ID=MMETSP0164_2-20130417/68897_1 /TAXON_ID=221442 /ORGANISM="Coccolithus pelagicus ssp braarudi, Strain PLY182g" /LENGTH=89 /DNA_ID=CAMNT_0025537209 /DNA_START=454 /DNA_END=724 /DNA_ORIENTATION=+
MHFRVDAFPSAFAANALPCRSVEQSNAQGPVWPFSITKLANKAQEAINHAQVHHREGDRLANFVSPPTRCLRVADGHVEQAVHEKGHMV